MNGERRFKRISFLLILAGMACNPYLLGYVFSPNGKIHSPPFFLFVILVQVSIIIAAIILFVKRRVIDTKAVLFSIVMVGIIICSVELGLRLIMFIYHGEISSRASMSMYRDKKWAVPLLREYEHLQTEYDQYLGWRTKQFAGDFTHVDSEGVRLTYNPTIRYNDSAETVFVFGGSAVWGAYVRDEGTIPSVLSNLLNRQAQRYIVFNYGERGYSFMQNAVRLVLLLQAGHVPNRVVFYEGVNDIISSYNTGHPDVNALDYELRKAFVWKKQSPLKHIGLIAKEGLENYSMIYKGLTKLLSLVIGEPPPVWTAKIYGEEELHDLSKAIAEHYAATVRLIENLAKVYNFSFVCVLQPVIFTKAHITDEEKHSDKISKDEKLKELFLDTYTRIDSSNIPRCFNFCSIFNKLQETVYSDYCHISEEGNNLVATKLFNILSSDATPSR